MTTSQVAVRGTTPTAEEVLADSKTLLQGLNLLGDSSDTSAAAGFLSAFTGPPQSVALIEAGATAMSKWWAAGLSGTVLAVWGALKIFWGNLDASNQRVLLWGAAIATAAAVLAIAHILASDLRGRAAAAVATIEARVQVAEAVLRRPLPPGEASASVAASGATQGSQLVALPGLLRARFTRVEASDEPGWYAVALITDGVSAVRYLLVKDHRQQWASADEVLLDPTPPVIVTSIPM